MSGKPSHKVFVVDELPTDASPDEKPFWNRIGSAWPHKDGKGLNVVLSSLTKDGRLVLREYTEKDEKAEAKVATFRKK